MKIELQRLSVIDTKKWLEMQIEAYAPLFEKYQDYETSPVCKSLEQVVERMDASFREQFFILKNEEIEGGA